MNDDRDLFIRKYKWYFIGVVIVAVLGYIIAYFCFFGDGNIPAGSGLEKKDWLSFLGAYLSFAGTVFVSMIAVLQSHFYSELNKEKAEMDRIKIIQPIFSIRIEDMDDKVFGTVEGVNFLDTLTSSKCKNLTISVENVGSYPVFNVRIFYKYIWQILKPNDKKTLPIAYSDSPDINKWENHLIQISSTDFMCSKDGFPKYFQISYDDVDGGCGIQEFELKEFDDVSYYFMERTYQI